MSYGLSKSRYTTGVGCPKALWLQAHKPEEFDESVISQSVMDTGNEVGDLAMGLFGDYTEVPYNEDRRVMLDRTRELLEAGTPVICEASFAFEGCFCSVDILKVTGPGRAELYEVKSSSEMKDIYFDDAAYQTWVVNRCGLTVTRTCLVHLNPAYVRQGDLDLGQLFLIEDITGRVAAMQPDVETRIAELKGVLAREQEPERDICPGCNSPYACGYWRYCTRMLPEKNVFCLSGKHMKTPTKFKYYNSGLVSFQDLLNGVPRKKLSDPVLTQLLDEPRIDREAIRGLLDTLTFPLYFLDYETFLPAIPLYDGDRPRGEQIPFQYSLHILDRPGGELRHAEFLAQCGRDPRREVAEHLCRDIPEGVCVLAYNMSFERTVTGKLAERFPDLADRLFSIRDRIRDLMPPFEKMQYYLPAMQGSYSIKYVLPALYPGDPELDYHSLEGVHRGGEASAAFLRMDKLPPEEQETLRSQLLKYCGLDTLAMVRVWEKLTEAVQ